MSELRWNPLLGEWMATATKRQERTFLPPPDFCPLCPTKAGGFPTEVPAENYDIVAFENKFPSLRTRTGNARDCFDRTLSRSAVAGRLRSRSLFAEPHDFAGKRTRRANL